MRELAAGGRLRQVASAPDEYAVLRSEAFKVAMPLVWERHTRPLENRKGHSKCASGLRQLAPECYDGFTDDLESVVGALMSYRQPIANLEGWITTRMANAIKDGHRVRRAMEMGAQQRVRVPTRLADRLGNDPWLVALAERVLQWAGVRHAAGTGLWPLRAWAEDRAAFTGSALGPESAVADDVNAVLSAMRANDPVWFETYVERPLGRKWASVAPSSPGGEGMGQLDADCLALVTDHERNEARLAEAASGSLTMIRQSLAVGTEARRAVCDALSVNFMSIRALRSELDRPPGDDKPAEVVAALLTDPVAVDRLVSKVLDIVG